MFFSFSGRRACARAVAALLLAGCATGARAQESPVRALTDAIGLTTESGKAADFVRESRPDKPMDYTDLSGAEKKRAPVKTPAELEAAKSSLVADRDKANAKLRQLGAERMAPVAPGKAPPRGDDPF